MQAMLLVFLFQIRCSSTLSVICLTYLHLVFLYLDLNFWNFILMFSYKLSIQVAFYLQHLWRQQTCFFVPLICFIHYYSIRLCSFISCGMIMFSILYVLCSVFLCICYPFTMWQVLKWGEWVCHHHGDWY